MPDPQTDLFHREPEFSAILMDPPWPERGAGRVKRGADRHYPTMDPAKMPAVIRGSGVWRVARDAHLYMWVTDNYLLDGLWLLEELGFRYVRTFCWVKEREGRIQSGLGQYARGSHELLLFGVRGSGMVPRTERRDISSVVDEPSWYGAERGKHSAKPQLFHELVEARSKGPYLEVFARIERPGWTCWGNEVTVGVSPF